MTENTDRLPGTGAAYPSDLEQNHGVDPTDPPVTVEPPAISTPAEAYEQDQVESVRALGEDRA